MTRTERQIEAIKRVLLEGRRKLATGLKARSFSFDAYDQEVAEEILGALEKTKSSP